MGSNKRVVRECLQIISVYFTNLMLAGYIVDSRKVCYISLYIYN